jgi:serine O-acetyltransferase
MSSLLREDLATLFALHERPTKGPRFVLAAVLFSLTNSGAQAVALYRLANALHARGLRRGARIVALLSTILTASEIDEAAGFGPGLMIHHPAGVVVHADARVGARCRIHSGVVLGLRSEATGVPRLGDDVALGTGAKLIGAVDIGDRVRVGANAVVTRDIPADHDALGIPAKAVPQRTAEPRLRTLAAA